MLAASIKDVKVVIIGDSGVGKSAILKRFFHNIFYEEDQATIGIDFLHKVVKLNDDTAVRLQLWDTAGQERFRQLAPSYIRDAVVALLVFDLTQPNILEQIARWTLFVERERGKETKIFLVGNKCDLKNKRKIGVSTITKIMKEYNAPYLETSAKTGHNINELFSIIAHMPFPQHKKSQSAPLNLSSQSEDKGITLKCC